MASIRKITVMAGILLGAFSALSPGWLFIVLLAAGIGLLLYRATDRSDRCFLTGLFLSGFALRAAFSFGLDLGSFAADRDMSLWKKPAHAREWDLGATDKTRQYLRMGDSDYYSARGWALAEYIRGSREPVVLFRLNQYGWNSYVDLIGFFYHLFGFSPSAVKGINCILGAGIGILVFILARVFFQPQAARWAACATVFFPSLIFWSSSNLKDTPFIFLTLLAVVFSIRFFDEKGVWRRIYWLILLGLTLLLHMSVREIFYLVLAASLICAGLIARWRIFAWVLTAGIGAGIFLLYWDKTAQLLRAVLGQIFHKHIGYVTTPGISYSLFPDFFYAPTYIWQWVQSGTVDFTVWMAILKAPIHLLLEPLPYRLDTLAHLPVLIQMILWYAVLIFATGGIAASLRQNGRRTLFLILPLVTFSFLIGLTNGNIGTLFRVRDVVTPFLLIYAAAGLRQMLTSVAASGSQLISTVSFIRERAAFAAQLRIQKITERVSSSAAALRTSSVREAGKLLLLSVLTNILLLALRGIEWNGWNVSFRLGMLALGLWASAVQSDWGNIKQTSVFLRRRNVRLS